MRNCTCQDINACRHFTYTARVRKASCVWAAATATCTCVTTSSLQDAINVCQGGPTLVQGTVTKPLTRSVKVSACFSRFRYNNAKARLRSLSWDWPFWHTTNLA